MGPTLRPPERAMGLMRRLVAFAACGGGLWNLAVQPGQRDELRRCGAPRRRWRSRCRRKVLSRRNDGHGRKDSGREHVLHRAVKEPTCHPERHSNNNLARQPSSQRIKSDADYSQEARERFIRSHRRHLPRLVDRGVRASWASRARLRRVLGARVSPRAARQSQSSGTP